MEDIAGGAFALAYREAEERKAEAEAAARRAQAEARAGVSHVYDPWAYPGSEPHDPTLYAHTGVGSLYGMPGCEHFRAELGDWTIGKEHE